MSQIREETEDEDGEGELKASIVAEYPLSSKEDAPMTLAVTSKVCRSLTPILLKTEQHHRNWNKPD